MASISYTVLRSARKTMALEVTRDQKVLVRSPRGVPESILDRFVCTHHDWIEAQLEKMKEYAERHPEPSPQQEEEYRRQAMLYLPERVNYYSQQMQLFSAGLRITGAKTRFGSCSSKNRICLSWRLMAYDSNAIDYVIVHELAHTVHKNHSAAFYALIERYLPDWKTRRKALH